MNKIMHCCHKVLILTILLITTNGSESKALASDKQDLKLQQKDIVKRGYSSANDFGPPIHVSSGILQLESSTPSSIGGVQQQHYSITDTNPWQSSNLSGGYEVWLDTASGGLQNFQPMLTTGSIPFAHGLATIGDVGSVFSTNQVHISFEQPTVHMVALPMKGVPSLDGHLSGVLHTQISSSRPHDPTTVVTGNVDFSNDASLRSKYSSLSYGR